MPAIQSDEQAVKVSSSAELQILAQNWVSNFNSANPSAKIKLDLLTEDKFQTLDHLSLVSDEKSAEINSQSNWKMVVGRDVIVPVVNAKNPMMGRLEQTGISSVKFARLLKDQDKRSWAACLTNGLNAPVNIYISDDEGVKNGLACFANTVISKGTCMMVKTPADVLAAVQTDPLAIGFCKLNDLRANLSGYENVRLLPIDKNGNGRAGIASIYRLRNERYGIFKDEKLLVSRFRKEIIHELGHTFGLIHCYDPTCVMRSSTYVEDIDQKNQHLCPKCREKLSGPT